MSTRSRSYVFTINNYVDEDLVSINNLSDDSKYIVVGKEVGDNNTPHYQGYVYFSEAKSFKRIKKYIPRAHIEVAYGTPEENRKYCTKQGNIVIEKGTIPEQGKRSDIDHIREVLEDTPRMKDVSQVARSYQAIKVAEVWLKYNEQARDWKPQVNWYHGSTGSGKTRTAREWLGDNIYTCLDSIKWWEGYDAHENVLIDDFRKDFCKFHQLLKLLDRYEYKVETKGGSRQLLAKKIAITSPYPPDEIYSCREDVQQLLRRIDNIILIGDLVSESIDNSDF